MIIIGFSANSSKLLPRIFCRFFRHCAPIIHIKKNRYIMLQFVQRRKISLISMTTREINLLSAYGWKFVTVNKAAPRRLTKKLYNVNSCVELCKLLLEIKSLFVFTPMDLYKKLKRHSAL